MVATNQRIRIGRFRPRGRITSGPGPTCRSSLSGASRQLDAASLCRFGRSAGASWMPACRGVARATAPKVRNVGHDGWQAGNGFMHRRAAAARLVPAFGRAYIDGMPSRGARRGTPRTAIPTSYYRNARSAVPSIPRERPPETVIPGGNRRVERGSIVLLRANGSLDARRPRLQRFGWRLLRHAGNSTQERARAVC
jgi:hypothetical protein